MKLWTKGKYELTDYEEFMLCVAEKRSASEAEVFEVVFKEIVFPINVTKCERNWVFAFTDATGREFDGNTFGFIGSNPIIFTPFDRQHHFKKHSNKPVNLRNDAQQLLDCAHLLDRIYVGGKLVSKPGDLEKLLRKSRELAKKEMERKLADANTTAEQCMLDLKLLWGE